MVDPAREVPRALDSTALDSTALTLPNPRHGKVRDLYDLPDPTGQPRVLIVATDRLSAFDVVLPTPIPAKGRVLTQMAVFWMRFVESRGLARTHLLSTDPGEIPDAALTGDPALSGGDAAAGRERLVGRIMIARACRVVPVECVVRGYIEGSGWKDYQATGSICGVSLPPGLSQADRLPQPIFTPATKEQVGAHDENVSFDRAVEHLGALGWPEPRRLLTTLRDRSLAIYTAASAYALARGIIIADTKFEFGVALDEGEGGDPILIDEALTPDSSRFWPADAYEPGQAQRSFDKQFVREYLETLVARGEWDKRAPGPTLPADIVARTLERYERARDLLTGGGER
ncbi:MAG: phosphoribosylaminoimidazolesuccinocarboxamide synthase [Phycisphaerales bacterium]|nr:phosphoribosylaminoimidazolesuccinocarboxamide synthase [Phycisphaerales bacterium]